MRFILLYGPGVLDCDFLSEDLCEKNKSRFLLSNDLSFPPLLLYHSQTAKYPPCSPRQASLKKPIFAFSPSPVVELTDSQ